MTDAARRRRVALPPRQRRRDATRPRRAWRRRSSDRTRLRDPQQPGQPDRRRLPHGRDRADRRAVPGRATLCVLSDEIYSPHPLRRRAPEHRRARRHGREDGDPGRLLEDLLHDRVAPRVCGRPAGARAAVREADDEQQLVRGELRPARGPRGPRRARRTRSSAMVAAFRERRDALVDGPRSHARRRVRPPGGLVLRLRRRARHRTGRARPWPTRLLEEAGVACVEGPAFGARGGGVPPLLVRGGRARASGRPSAGCETCSVPERYGIRGRTRRPRILRVDRTRGGTMAGLEEIDHATRTPSSSPSWRSYPCWASCRPGAEPGARLPSRERACPPRRSPSPASRTSTPGRSASRPRPWASCMADPEMQAFLAPIERGRRAADARAVALEVPPLVMELLEQLQGLRGPDRPSRSSTWTWSGSGPSWRRASTSAPHAGDFVDLPDAACSARSIRTGKRSRRSEQDGRTWWEADLGPDAPFSLHATTVDTAFVLATDEALLESDARGREARAVPRHRPRTSSPCSVAPAAATSGMFLYGNVAAPPSASSAR